MMKTLTPEPRNNGEDKIKSSVTQRLRAETFLFLQAI